MATFTHHHKSEPSRTDFIPPLENGDRLTREEFERRYEAMPKKVKAELIEGIVYMASPVRITRHGIPHGRVMLWLGTFAAATPGVDFANNSTVRLDTNNEPQPDAILFVKEEFGGGTYFSDDDYLEGAPELVVEIASSSVSFDTVEKKEIYRRNGVREYIIWRVDDRAIDWFVLGDDSYTALEPDADGIIESRFFAGLRLDTAALIRDDLSAVLATLQSGLSARSGS